MFEAPPDPLRALADPDAAEQARLEAERELCARLAPRIRLYGLRHLRDESAAADLVQEVLLILLAAVRDGRLTDPAAIDRFAFGTSRNLVARFRRGEHRTRNFERAAEPLLESGLPPAYSAIDAARLAACLGQVDARGQRVVLRTFQDEASAEELAAELGTTPGNVRVIRHRVLAALQRCVEGAPA